MNKIYEDDFKVFELESLTIDYLRFNLIPLDQIQISELASYFQTLGFNSYQKDRDENKSRQKIKFNSKNKFEVVFILYTKYQKGTHLEFSGFHAKKMYNLMKHKFINLKNLTKLNSILRRLDICYDRSDKSTDRISSKDFINDCFKTFQDSYPNTNLNVEKNQRGLIFKIGHRRSQKHYRLYPKHNSLRFEFEIKLNKSKMNDLYHLLLEDRFKEFEKTLSYQFFKYSFEIFSVSRQPEHIDWLMKRVRPYQCNNKLYGQTSIIRSDYINYFAFKQFEQKSNFINFLQLLMYVRTLNYETKSLKSNYRGFKFRLRDFLKYTQADTLTEINHEQLVKLRKFFTFLKKNLVVEYFTDEYYKMLATIAELDVYKSEQNIWLVEIWIAEGLFEYFHPFIFPDFFRKKLTEDEFRVAFEILTIFSSNLSTKKEFNLEKFYNSYSSNINGRRQKQIREFFIKYLKILFEDSKIENEIVFSSSSLDKSKKINQLIYSDLVSSKSFSVFESIDVIFK